jgi:hypothetical protein
MKLILCVFLISGVGWAKVPQQSSKASRKVSSLENLREKLKTVRGKDFMMRNVK